MIRWMARIVMAGFVGAMVAAWVSCGGDVRNDPWLVEKLKEVDNQIAKTKDLPIKVQDLNADVASLRDEIARLRGGGGVTTTPVALAVSVRSLNQRLAELDMRLQQLEVAVRTRGGAPSSKATAAPAATPAPPAPTPPPIAPKATPIVLRTTPPAAGPTTATAPGVKPGAKPRKPGLVEAPSAPRGYYYTAVQGDTVKSVATKFNLAVEDFCKANTFIRPDSVLMPGQSYWIPVPKK